MTNQVPFVIRNGLVTIAAVDYSNLFTKARLVPSQDIQTFTPLVPSGVVQDVGPASWQWEVTFADDWTATTGLSTILFSDDVNQTVLVVTMAEKAGTGNRLATFNIVAVATPFGGDVGSFNSNDVTFPVNGQPVFSAQP